MFIVPSTFISCATRAGTIFESTTRRVSITVSISAAWTIRRSSACCVPTRTNSVRSSGSAGSFGRDADDRLVGGVAFEHLRQPAAPVRRQAGDEDPAAHPEPDRLAARQHRVELLLDPAADLLGDRLHEARVLPRLLAPLVGRDRLQEADVELRRQVRGPGRQRRDRDVDQAGELLERVEVAEDRHRLLGADDRDGHDRRPGPHRRLDEAAAAEAAQAVAVLVELLGALAALGEDEHELFLVVEQPVDVRGVRGDAAELGHEHREPRIALEEVLDGQVQRARARVLGLDRLGDHRRVGRQRARVVGDQQRAAGGRDVLDPLDRDPEPVVVEELVERLVERVLDALGAAPVGDLALGLDRGEVRAVVGRGGKFAGSCQDGLQPLRQSCPVRRDDHAFEVAVPRVLDRRRRDPGVDRARRG